MISTLFTLEMSVADQNRDKRNKTPTWCPCPQLGLYKKYPRDFCVYRGVFRDGALNAANRIFSNRSRCHGSEILDKIDYNSTSVSDVCEIFAAN